MSDETVKYLLSEAEIPTQWVNLLGELPGEPLPPLHPGTMDPAGPADLAPLFPMALIEQEVSPSPSSRYPSPSLPHTGSGGPPRSIGRGGSSVS